MTIRVLIADDHPVVRMGMRALLSTAPDMTVVAEACDGEEAVALFEQHQPDVALVDLRMPHMDGVAALYAITQAHPDSAVLVLTSYDGDADINRALDAGARGYLLKDMIGAELIDAVRAVAAGQRVMPREVTNRLAEFTPRVDLTPRETEVLVMAAKGLRNRDIGRALGCAEQTIKVHLKHVMTKLGVEGRTEAVTLALQRGMIHLDD